jgi:hypothetical protein
VKYLVTTSSTLAGADSDLGIIVGPRVRGLRPIAEGRQWAADNDAFHGKFKPELFMKHLTLLLPYQDRCLFVVAPDVRLDAVATLALFAEWGPIIRGMGYPVAYVAQDGAEALPLPDADALFIGGSDKWRLHHAAALTAQAKALGWWVHVGRVNSGARLSACAAIGADSADGTYSKYKGMPQTLIDLKHWKAQAKARREHPTLELI